jgi:hypothetical protein
MTPRIHVAFAVVASVVVVGAVAWGFVLVGSPGARRLERFDKRRLEDLQAIAREIRLMVLDPTNKALVKKPLPKTLKEAAERARDERLSLRDPQTDEPYEYVLKNETTYELCATFARARESDRAVFWNHTAGKHCFTIDVHQHAPEVFEYTPY